VGDRAEVSVEQVVPALFGSGDDRQIPGRPAAYIDGDDRREVSGHTVTRIEQLGVGRTEEEAVVVEIDVAVTEPLDVMQLRLDCMRVEYRKHSRVGEDVAMIDDGDLRMVCIQHVWYQIVSADVDVVGPRCV